MKSKRRRAFRILLALAALGAAGVVAAWAAVYLTLLRDLPDLRSVEDYRPPITSQVLDRNGVPVGEFSAERRRLKTLEQIPETTALAFVAGEDGGFFEHSGIDYVSILRAAWVNLLAGGEIKQGGSTITQQMVKGLLLTPERKIQRKIKELILARRIEQQFSKQEILYLYLNQIYFGHGAWGIGEASRRYFGKEVEDISISESAMLAGLPQRPSAYSPISNPSAAEARRKYVLRRMHEEEFIDTETYEASLEEIPVLAEPAEYANYDDAGYFNEEVRRALYDALGGDTVLGGGLVIETTLDMDLQRAAVREIKQGLRELDRRQGYRGPVRRADPLALDEEKVRVAEENKLLSDEAERAGPPSPDRVLHGVVVEVDSQGDRARIAIAPDAQAWIPLESVSWARTPDPSSRPRSVRNIETIFAVGDVARFKATWPEIKSENPVEIPWRDNLQLTLHQEPEVQGSLVSIEVASGDVLALVGGYEFRRSEFNRATQAQRQPGSGIKPLLYAAALEKEYTPASILVDRPVVYEDPDSGFVWRPENYGRRFLGKITLREALARSINNATIHLVRDVGIRHVLDYVRRLGIESPMERNLSIALGANSVNLLEITRAYAVFPAGGRAVVPHFIRRVTDRDGNVLLENIALGSANPFRFPNDTKRTDARGPDLAGEVFGDLIADEKRVVSPAHAYLATDLLRAVVEDPRGTGRKAQALRKPVGGKTGTTNEGGDAWFIGFSPDVATGVWVGYDEKRVLGLGETGGRAALPIWTQFMADALAHRSARDFPVPEGVVFARIDRTSGLLADATSRGTYFQAFLEGTEPTETADQAMAASESDRLLRLDSF